MNQRQEFKLASNRSLIVYFNFVLIFLLKKKKKIVLVLVLSDSFMNHNTQCENLDNRLTHLSKSKRSSHDRYY